MFGHPAVPRLKAVAKLVVSVALIAYLVHAIGLGQIAEQARLDQPLALVGAALVMLMTIALNGLSFHEVAARYQVPWQSSIWGGTMAWAWGMITPGRLGEFSILHYLGTQGVPKGELAFAGLLIRVVSILFLLVMGVFAASINALIPPCWGAFTLSLLLVLSGLAYRFRAQWIRFLQCRVPARFRTHFVESSFVEDGKSLLRIGGIQALRILLMFYVTFLLFRAVGGEVRYGAVAMVNSITRVATMVPVSFNGLGVREGIQVLLYDRWFAVLPSVIFSMGVWVNALMYGLAALCWAASLFHKPRQARVPASGQE